MADLIEMARRLSDMHTEYRESAPDSTERMNAHARLCFQYVKDGDTICRALLGNWTEGMDAAPKDEIIWVYCPSHEGLPELVSLCQWSEDAGFTVDEFRDPTHWQRLIEPSPPSR